MIKGNCINVVCMYPKWTTHGFVVLCFLVDIQSALSGIVWAIYPYPSKLRPQNGNNHVDWLVQERRGSSALALELRFYCINLSIWLRQYQWGMPGAYRCDESVTNQNKTKPSENCVHNSRDILLSYLCSHVFKYQSEFSRNDILIWYVRHHTLFTHNDVSSHTVAFTGDRPGEYYHVSH